MRDFRDAKAMAQTLRETLEARSVSDARSSSLTVSESLELVARMFGLSDWNVLAAKIRTAGQGARDKGVMQGATPDGADQTSLTTRKEIPVTPALLDRYVGTYRFHNAVFTVIRDEDHLSARLTGQGSIPYYAASETEFFAKDVDVQLSFVCDPDGRPTAVILHQHGSDHTMQRIDAATAQQLQRAIEDRMKSGSASLGTEAALRRLIDSVASGQPNYAEMSAGLAEATRQQLPRLQRGLAELGPVRSMEFLGVGPQGQDVYSVWHEGGATHWHIALEAGGTISSAFVNPGP